MNLDGVSSANKLSCSNESFAASVAYKAQDGAAKLGL